MKLISDKYVTLYALERSTKNKSGVTAVRIKVFYDFLKDPELIMKESYVIRAKTCLDLRGTVFHVKETETEIKDLISTLEA